MKDEKRLLAERLKWIRFLVAAVLLVAVCVYFYARYQQAKDTDVTSTFVSGRLESVSELTTSKLTYTGLIKYSEGNIPFLTKNSFSMIYTATVCAGVDLSQTEIEVTKKRVTIMLPEGAVQSVNVDADSIEFYDEHWALFNWTEKKDITNAVSVAEEDVLKKADTESLLENARVQTEAVIQGILTEAVGDRELVIQWREK